MIQNYLVFCVKSDLTFVEGSLPSGKLVANDVNRNSIFVIAPHIGTIITANFITTTQGDLPRTTFGTYVGDKMSVEDLVDKSESYYNLIKDWNVFEFKLPSTTLSFIARNRTGQIGISFSFDEYVIPAIKPIYGDFLGTITSTVGLTSDVGYYVIGGVGLEIYDPKTDEDIELGYNDILVSTIEPAFYKVNAYHYKGSTGTVKYTVDPSILNDNFEPIEPSITTQIVGKVNENSNNIALIFTAITTNVNDISGLTARVSTNESDIADLELNVVKTITRTNTHSIETILNRTGNNVDIGSNVRLDVANNGLLKVGINGLSVSNNDVALSVKNSVIADTQGLATKINEPLEAHKISGSAHSDIRSDLATRELASNKGVASGYAPLDNNTKLPLIYLYDSVLGQLEYAGTFNPNDGYPTMTNALSPNRGVRKGDYFISIGNAVIDTVDYKVGDWAIRSGDGTWAKIDNTDAVASVNGKLGVVVLDGLDIVVGGGDNTTLRAKVVSIDQALADIYRKSETYTQLETNNKIALELLNYYTKANTYSRAEVDLLISNLSHFFNLKETAIEYSTGVYDFPNGATKPYTLFQDYTWVKFRIFNNVSGRARAYYTFIKPAMAVSGNSTLIQIQRTPVRYARIRRTNGDIVFDIIDDNDIVDTSLDYTMRCWGEELVQLTANEVDYDNSTSGLVADKVQTAIDELASEKADKLVLTNLVSNSDLSVAKPSPNQNEPLGFSYSNATNITLSGGIATFTATAQFGQIYIPSSNSNAYLGNKLYLFSKFKSDSNEVRLTYGQGVTTPHSGDNNYNFVSMINDIINSERFLSLSDYRASGWTPIQVDYIGAIDLTAVFGAGNEPSKEVMDRFIQTKGFFQTKDITIKDLFNDKADKLVLTNLVSNSDLSVAKPSPNQNEPLGFSYAGATNFTLSGGIATFTPTAQLGRIQQTITYPDNSTIYYFASVKTTSLKVAVGNNYDIGSYHSGDNTYQLLSLVYKNNPATQPIKVVSVRGDNTSGFVPIEVDYIGAINLTAIFGAGKEPTKEQMDAIIKLKGYFDTTTIDIKDLMLLGFNDVTDKDEFIKYYKNKERRYIVEADNNNTFNIAHQGFRKYGSSCSYQAIVYAKKYGFNAVEIDVRQTQDEVLVLKHDDYLSYQTIPVRDINGFVEYNDGAGNFYYYNEGIDQLYTYDFVNKEYVASSVDKSTLNTRNYNTVVISANKYNVLSRIDANIDFSKNFGRSAILTFKDWVILIKKLNLLGFIDFKVTLTTPIMNEIYTTLKRLDMEENVWFANSNITITRTVYPNAKLFIVAEALPTNPAQYVPYLLSGIKNSVMCSARFGSDGSSYYITESLANNYLDLGIKIGCWTWFDGTETKDEIKDEINRLLSLGVSFFTLDEYSLFDLINEEFVL